MGQAKYTYTFVKSGEVPSNDLRTGMKRADCADNARMAASEQKHSQDIFRRATEDAQGHRVLDDEGAGWQLVRTVGKPSESKISKEEAITRECIRCIQEVMPNELAVDRAPVMKWRREGMVEAIQAIKRHFSLS
jgi:hypothetical protein